MSYRARNSRNASLALLTLTGIALSGCAANSELASFDKPQTQHDRLTRDQVDSLKDTIEGSTTRFQTEYKDYSIFAAEGAAGASSYCLVLVEAGEATAYCSGALPGEVTLDDGTELALAASAPSPHWEKVATNLWLRQ